MNVLIIGTGGREAALAWKLSQSPQRPALFMGEGNEGLLPFARCLPLGDDIPAFCRAHKIEFVVIGPEAPLLDGLGDRLRQAKIKVFGPSAAAAQLEGSKFFTRSLCADYSIPSPLWRHFDDKQAALQYIETQPYPFVVKADGLAAGKGVAIVENAVEAHTAIENIFDGKFGTLSLVIEEFMRGEEASFFVLTDGKTALPFGTAQDHKRAFDGDKGPNTGGMGAFSPAKILSPPLEQQVMEEIIHPTLQAMRDRGTPFQGVLYAGLMIYDNKAKLVEFNVRFGDPECQALMMRLDSDLLEILLACEEERLTPELVRWSADYAALVVLAAKGYPGAYQKGTRINSLEQASQQPDTQIFSAAVKRKNSVYLADGGRVLNVAALGKSLDSACQKAYQAVALIDWQEGFYRTDIGKKYRG